MYQAILQTPLGPLGMQLSTKGITALLFLPEDTTLLPPQTALAEKAVAQLQNYFTHPEHIFNLPLDLAVTPYQRRVLNAVAKIPSGKTKTYGAVATLIKSGPRAVGNACGSNPVPIIIPCHRVVGAYGLGGYGGSLVERPGAYLNIKRWLLRHELGSGAGTSS